MLAAGFPCQPFSIAGVSKRQSLGMAHGFKCVTQGNLFFQLATIIKAKRPPVLFLENVKNLQSHDKGPTWTVIRETLDRPELLGFPSRSLTPQPGFRSTGSASTSSASTRRNFPEAALRVSAEAGGRKAAARRTFSSLTPIPKYTLTPHLWNYLQRYAEGHRAKGNGFGFGWLIPGHHPDPERPILQRRLRGSHPHCPNKPPRRLTPRNARRLMGFDEKHQNNIVVSDTQAYKQFGNAVVPKVVEAVGNKSSRCCPGNSTENGCLAEAGQHQWPQWTASGKANA